MDKYTIITLKKKGLSNRQIAKQLRVDRKTVAKVWATYTDAQDAIINNEMEPKQYEGVIEAVLGETSYDSSQRTKRKFTQEIQKRVVELLESEEEKRELLGITHKQKLSGTQIHSILISEGYDIGMTTIINFLREIKQTKEVFIRQQYEFGCRLEFDFGEVKLMINHKRVTFYLAVFAAPASGFRYAYLYKKQNQQVFQDAHVQFFEHIGGSWKEVVYDNMKNVIQQFVGKHEKIINQECLRLALYYNYEVKTTNTYSGHEKGTVENGVKVIRNQVFTKKYQFESYEEACAYLEEKLIKLNKDSLIEEEKKHLSVYRPPFELAKIEKHTVDKYSCIRVENNFYSIPDILIGYSVIVKNYLDRLLVYSNKEFVCEHKKIDGSQHYQLVLTHYLKTLTTKPGALTHSLVLKQHPDLFDIYHRYFKTRTKEFIEILQKNKDSTPQQLIETLMFRSEKLSDVISTREDMILEQSRKQLLKINQLLN